MAEIFGMKEAVQEAKGKRWKTMKVQANLIIEMGGKILQLEKKLLTRDRQIEVLKEMADYKAEEIQ